MCALRTALRLALACLLCWTLQPVRATAQTDEALAAQAEYAFRLGVQKRAHLLQARKYFSEATDRYLELHERGFRSPALYLNLGNAAVLADRWPIALWAYHLGLKLDPNDARLRAHRNFVRAKVMLPSSSQGRPESEVWPPWLYQPSASILAVITGISYALAWFTATGSFLWYRPRLYPWAMLALFVAAISGFGWWYGSNQAEVDRQTPLVVLMDNTALYRGNGKSYPAHPEMPLLPRGMEARELHRRGAWMQIRLSTGEIGWVPLSQVRVVEP